VAVLEEIDFRAADWEGVEVRRSLGRKRLLLNEHV